MYRLFKFYLTLSFLSVYFFVYSSEVESNLTLDWSGKENGKSVTWIIFELTQKYGEKIVSLNLSNNNIKDLWLSAADIRDLLVHDSYEEEHGKGTAKFTDRISLPCLEELDLSNNPLSKEALKLLKHHCELRPNLKIYVDSADGSKICLSAD